MSSIFKDAFRRRRSIISLGSGIGSAIAISKVVNGFLLPTPGSHILIRAAAQQSHAKEERKPPNSPSSTLSPSFFETQDQKRQREFLEGNLLELTQLKKEPNNEQLVMEILSDFAEKHSGLPSFNSELWKLLASRRLKELGVGFNPVRIPDKQDWKASWHKEGKPSWLGTARTRADERFYFSASITGYIEKGTNGGGFGVILFDNYGSPRVVSVGVSPEGHVPLLYYQLQRYRSALQLSSEYGIGSGIILQCSSYKANRILELCRESMSYVSACGSNLVPGDPVPVCTCCMGRHLYNVVDDFDVLFPVIKEIVEFLCKVEWCANTRAPNCCASGHLEKCYSMPSTEEMGLFKLMDKDFKLYEMVMKPDKFPEEVEDVMYDEVFKGGRIHSDEVKFDLTMHIEELFRKYSAGSRH